MNLVVQMDEGSEPAFVLMHFLGGSTREWDEAVLLLGPSHKTLRIDLPGFGASAEDTRYAVSEMADAVAETIAAAGLKRYVLVGHSMSGKIAMALARRAQDAQDKALLGLVLVAPSPPRPEPMTDAKRGSMIALLGAHHADELDRARSFIATNASHHLTPPVQDRAAHELLRMNRTAWVAWLSYGSQEDWADRIGVLSLPALVVAGDKDTSLGPKTQAEATMPHLGNARMAVLEGCGHLPPMEQPQQLATLLLEFAATLGGGSAIVPEEYLSFIAGDRVSPRTRAAIESRLAATRVAEGVLTAEQQRTLRAVLDRVVPQGANRIDLAAAIVNRLAEGKGHGWRYAVLPADLEAYRAALDALAKQHFENLGAKDQDALLEHLAAHEGSPQARWFEDLRSDAVEAYLAHPATLARLGYSGIGVGGAETPQRGFVALGPNEREDWEPVPTLADGVRTA